MWEESPEGVASTSLKGAPRQVWINQDSPRGAWPCGGSQPTSEAAATGEGAAPPVFRLQGTGGLHKPGAPPAASGLLVEGGEIDPSRGEGWDALPPVFWLTWKKCPGHDPQQEDRVQVRAS